MIILTLAFMLSFFISSVALYFSLKKNLQLVDELEKIEEKLDDSAKILEDCYEKIEKKSKIEVFSDDPIVKELVEDMKDAKNAIMLISESFSTESIESDE